ncbi:MAG: diguanylate cyclase [Acidobacteriota bacterium]|nr:diguanylate cyclase [Acidobacteriota bacterium]
MVSPADILNANIMVVDDVEANVALLERLLLDAGYTSVSSTSDPHAVCDLQRRHRFSLILLDLQMPGMDGFQVLDALKEIEKDDYVPVLVITAIPMHKLRALRDGAKDFLSKPFDVPEMLLRVRNMLEVRLLHEATRDHGKTLESLALTDPLTGLANRRLLVDRLSMEMVHARREQCGLALLYLDLDGFKEINNTLGHAAGDALLKMVAGRLESTIREGDTVARLGGDEFVILVRLSGADEAVQVAMKVIEAVSQPYVVEGQPASITVSAGIGLYPVHGEDADTLMKSADLALYEAKRAGKNVYRIAAQ